MKPYVCVVGAVNLDICGRPEKKLIFRDSNPGAVTLTPGGVGRNIAHDLRLLGVEVKFLTAFGGDSHAQLLRNDCVELGMDLSCALDVPGGTIGIEIGANYAIRMTGTVNKVAVGDMHPQLFEVKV